MIRTGADRFRRLSKGSRVVLALLAAAPVMAVVIGLQRYVIARMRGVSMDWAEFLGAHATFWASWMAVGAAVAPLALRIISARRRTSVRALALTGLGVVAVTVHPLLDLGLRKLELTAPVPAPFAEAYALFLFAPLAHNVLVYVAIVGLTYAMWYYEHFRDRELAAAQLGAQLTQARLDALRAQLNPHFLFNAMNSIAMLVRGNNNAQAVRMLAGLSDLMRWALDDSLPKEIPLSRELEVIERYLAIEQVRFQNRLRVETDVDARALPMLVPTLLLQPLVENAIRHGIGRRRSAGELRIAAAVGDTTLVIEVRDDGPGFPPSFHESRGTGIGLRNTESRLAAAYGDAWSLELSSRAEGGAIVRVTLPARTSVEAEIPRATA